jgi:hypothetical protein
MMVLIASVGSASAKTKRSIGVTQPPIYSLPGGNKRFYRGKPFTPIPQVGGQTDDGGCGQCGYIN